MPYDDPDPTDPMTLTGVELACDDPGAVRDMAACFIEEYLRLGLSAEAIAAVFEGGEYAGPTLARRQLGSEAIAELIAEHVAIRGPQGARVHVDQRPHGTYGLPVLER